MAKSSRSRSSPMSSEQWEKRKNIPVVTPEWRFGETGQPYCEVIDATSISPYIHHINCCCLVENCNEQMLLQPGDAVRTLPEASSTPPMQSPPP